MKQPKIITLITTYNRPELFERTIKQVVREAKLYGEHFVIIYDDGSDRDYAEKVCDRLVDAGIDYKLERCSINHGKKHYWYMMNEMYQELIMREWDYVVQLPDDLQLVSYFYRSAVRLYDGIDNKSKVCLNLYRCRREGQWGSHQPKTVYYNGVPYRDTGWVDMCFIAKRKFMEALDFSVHAVMRDWDRMSELGSGVGAQISRRLRAVRWLRLYQVTTSLVIDDGQHDSVMNANQTTPKLKTVA